MIYPQNLRTSSYKHSHPGSCSYCQHWPWNSILWFSAAEPPIHLLLLGICLWLVQSQENISFPIALAWSKLHFCLCLLQLFFCLPLQHQTLITVRNWLMSKVDMSSGKATLMIHLQWWHLFASYFKGPFHHTVVAKRHVPGNLYLPYGKQEKILPSQTAKGGDGV